MFLSDRKYLCLQNLCFVEFKDGWSWRSADVRSLHDAQRSVTCLCITFHKPSVQTLPDKLSFFCSASVQMFPGSKEASTPLIYHNLLKISNASIKQWMWRLLCYWIVCSINYNHQTSWNVLVFMSEFPKYSGYYHLNSCKCTHSRAGNHRKEIMPQKWIQQLIYLVVPSSFLSVD